MNDAAERDARSDATERDARSDATERDARRDATERDERKIRATSVTAEKLLAGEHLLMQCVSGSRAYGLDTPESDTDIRGVFVLPEEEYLGLTRAEQVNDETNDVTFYEIGRYVELLLKNNPNTFEILAAPAECVRYKDPLFDLLAPEIFISKLCRNTFAGYARDQIKKARGLNKKIVNPMPEARKGILDFCHVIKGQGAVPLEQWLRETGRRQEHCGLVNVPHMQGIRALYYDERAHETDGKERLGFRGIVQKSEANDTVASSVPKGLESVAVMCFNKDAYRRWCKEYREYRQWEENRNESRYRSNIEHGRGYDAKNLMHTFRLLDMAEEIARDGMVIVRRPNREELLKIRRGEFAYEELVARAEERIERIGELFEKSALPETPDYERANAALVEIRRRHYRAASAQ